MRCNVGVDPGILLDQHLIAEYRELFIPWGQQIKRNWEPPKIPIPPTFRLGTGHINFFKDKHEYLRARHGLLVQEMTNRGFTGKYSYPSDIPEEYDNPWDPDEEASSIIRDRIIERILTKPSWYRFKRSKVEDIDSYIDNLRNAPLYFV